jgi:hypothetical protein
MRSRPLGITIASLLCFVATLQYGALAILMAVRPSAVLAYLHALSPGGSGPERVHLAMGRLEVVYYIAMAGLTVWFGIGLWRLRSWTRLVMLAAIALSLTALMVAIPQVARAGETIAWALWTLRAALCAFWAWYLMRKDVRNAFAGASLAPQVA